MRTWKQRAREAVKAGYQTGNPWERQLLRHLKRNFPFLTSELEATGEMLAYCQVQTAGVMDLMDTMLDQGMKPDAVRELAMEQLFQVPSEERERTAWWEIEDGQAAAAAAAPQLLSSNL